MGKSKSLKNIVEIDWQNRTFSYQLSDDELGQVYFRKLHSSNDWFKYCCSIAIAQKHHVDERNVTNWRGADNTFVTKVLDAFGWHLKSSSRNIYWTHYFSRGLKAQFHITETWRIDRDDIKKWAPATLLFNIIDGYVLGKPLERVNGTYNLWHVNFINTDEEFNKFRLQVLELLDTGVQTPRNSVKIRYEYFRPIENILGIEIPKTGIFKDPVWFRGSGPLAIDFQKGRIYRNKEKVTALKNHVLKHKISMLESPVATGKTVLVRSLAFEACDNKDLRIFYFDCDSTRGFLPTDLVNELESKEGIFIIENIHLEPRKLQSIIRQLLNLTNQHVLFTSRPLFREREYLSPDELKEIHFFPQPVLFEDTDNIIDLYTSSNLGHSLPLEERNRIKEVTSGNYKMLGYALQGYVQKQGKGEPEEWLEKGINHDLQRLEYVIGGQDNPNPRFPEIVLAISPLHMNEVLTAESFLRNQLHFDREDINALNTLVELCEITSQRATNGEIFYGLPHSAQARAYWMYGVMYKKRSVLPEYADFIYDYVKSNASNGLEAITQADRSVSKALVTRLDAEGALAGTIEKECSYEVLIRWIRATEHHVLSKKNVQMALAHRLETFDDGIKSSLCLDFICDRDDKIALNVWNLMNHRATLDRILAKNNAFDIAWYVLHFRSCLDGVSTQLWTMLGSNTLVAKLDEEQSVLGIGMLLAEVCEDDPQLGRIIWDCLDHHKLATKLSQTERVRDVCLCLARIYKSPIGETNEKWVLTQLEAAAKRLMKEKFLWVFGDTLKIVCNWYIKAGEILWDFLDHGKLATRPKTSEFF